MKRVPLRRVLRLTGLALAAVAALLVVGVLVVLVAAQGPRLGWLVTKVLPATAGEIKVGGGRISVAAWAALLSGGRAPVQLNDVSVTDPEGTVVLNAQLITTEVELHLGPPRIILHDLRVSNGSWRLGQMKSRRGLGFPAAFAPRAPAGAPRRPREPGAGFLFQIAGATLQHLDTALDFPTWGLLLKDVMTTGSMMVDGRDPRRPLFAFDVRTADARDGGVLRILRDTRAIRLPFEHAEIERVAITPERPNELLLLVKGAMTGRSRLRGSSTFAFGSRLTGERPGIDMAAAIDNPANALTAMAAHSDAAAWRSLVASGNEGALSVRLKGPYDALRGALSLENLDVTYRDRLFRRLRLKVDASLRPLQLSVHDLAFGAPGGGRVNLDLEVDAALEVEGDVRFHHVATDSYLPAPLRPFAAGALTGRVAARGGLRTGSASLKTLDLTLTRTGRAAELPQVVRLRGGAAAGKQAAGDPLAVALNVPALAFSDGTLTVRRLNAPFPVLGGRLTLDGKVTFWDKTRAHFLPSPQVALTLAATGADLDRLGLRTLIGGRLTFRADALGPLDRLGVRLTLLPASQLTVLGDRYTASQPIELRLADGELHIPSLQLREAAPGGKGRVTVRGEVGLRGRAALDLEIGDHHLAALPGLRGGGLPVQGLVDARLHLRGPPNDPDLAGTINVKQVVLRGVPLGDGQLTLTPTSRRRVRVNGALFRHFNLEGSIVDQPEGPSIALDVDLRAAPLDALLPPLRALEGGRGVASGRVTMNLRAGEPAAFDGSFSEINLSYAVRGRRPPGPGAPPRLSVHNVGPVNVRMRGWGDELIVDPANLDLGAGPVQVAGRLDRGRLDVSVNGPLALEPLQPLVATLTDDTVDRLGGQLAAQLKLAGTLINPIVQGRAAIVRPVELWLRQPAGTKLRVTAGSLALLGNTLRLEAFTARVAAQVGKPPVRFEGTIRADGRMTGLLPGTPPILSGRLTITDASLALPSPGLAGETIRLPSAALVGDGRVLTIESLQAAVGGGTVTVASSPGKPATIEIASLQPPAIGAVDLPVVGRRINWSPVGGLDIDQLDFELRAFGDARRGLFVTGDVRLIAGRFLADAARPPAPRPTAPARPGVRPPAPRRPTLLDRVVLDVRLHTVGDKFVIKKNHFPALHLDLDVHARGAASNPRIEAQAKATDLYGLLALMIYRLIR